MLLIKAFPHGEGGSCVPRKHETDEGVIFPFSRFRRHFTRAGAVGDIDGSRKYQGDCDRRESREGATPATFLSERLGVLSGGQAA